MILHFIMARRAAYGGLYVKHQEQTIGGKKYEYWYVYKSTQDEHGKAKNVGPLGKAAIDERTGKPFFDPQTQRFRPLFENENQVAYIYYNIDKKEWVPIKNPTGETINELQSKSLFEAGKVISDWNLEKHKAELKGVRGGKERGKIVNLHPVSGPTDIPLYFKSRAEFRAEFNEMLEKTVGEERKRFEEKETKLTSETEEAVSKAEKKVEEAERKEQQAEAFWMGEQEKLKERRLKQIKDQGERKKDLASLYSDFNEALKLTGEARITVSDVKKPETFKKKRQTINRQMKELVKSKGGEEVRKARARANIIQKLTTARPVFGAATEKQLEKWVDNREVHIETETKKDLALKMPKKGTTLSTLKTDEGAPAWYTDKKIMGAATRRLRPWHELDRPPGEKGRKQAPSKWPTINRDAISLFFHSLPSIHEAELYPDYNKFIKSSDYRGGDKTLEDFVLEEISDRMILYTMNINKDHYQVSKTNREERILGVAR